jgi:HNH endonuclease
MPSYRPVRERLLSRLVLDPATGCLLWTGCLRHGYGVIEIGRKAVGVHRVAWELLVGPIPEGLELDHLCRNRACAAPAHLEPVTHRVNVLRGTSPAAAAALAVACPAGHAYDLVNTHVRKNGKRDCLTCARERMRRNYARKRALA